jgi:hypothetical protein
MNIDDYPFRHSGYEFPETGFPEIIEEDVIVETLFD